MVLHHSPAIGEGSGSEMPLTYTRFATMIPHGPRPAASRTQKTIHKKKAPIIAGSETSAGEFRRTGYGKE
jgi:hypothetical protein